MTMWIFKYIKRACLLRFILTFFCRNFSGWKFIYFSTVAQRRVIFRASLNIYSEEMKIFLQADSMEISSLFSFIRLLCLPVNFGQINYTISGYFSVFRIIYEGIFMNILQQRERGAEETTEDNLIMRVWKVEICECSQQWFTSSWMMLALDVEQTIRRKYDGCINC